VTVELPEHIERWLYREAERRGIRLEQVLRDIILSHFTWLSSGPEAQQSIAELFAEWTAEDHTDDLEEISRRNREWEEFKLAIERNRPDPEDSNARTAFP
jgi:hypothetical protein